MLNPNHLLIVLRCNTVTWPAWQCTGFSRPIDTSDRKTSGTAVLPMRSKHLCLCWRVCLLVWHHPARLFCSVMLTMFNNRTCVKSDGVQIWVVSVQSSSPSPNSTKTLTIIFRWLSNLLGMPNDKCRQILCHQSKRFIDLCLCTYVTLVGRSIRN